MFTYSNIRDESSSKKKKRKKRERRTITAASRDDDDNFSFSLLLSLQASKVAFLWKRITPTRKRASGGMKTFQIIIVSISLNYFAHEIQLKIDDILSLASIIEAKSRYVLAVELTFPPAQASSAFFTVCDDDGWESFQQFFNLSYELIAFSWDSFH